MRDYILRRVLLGGVTLWVVSLAVFLLVRISGDPVHMMTDGATAPDQIEFLRRELGLDKPLIVQYGTFLSNALRGNFGVSFTHRTPTLELYLERLPASLELAFLAAALGIGFGVIIGVLSALRIGGGIDTFGRMFAFLGLSIPSFWLGLLMILIFSVELRWLPTSGRGGFRHLIMPAICLAWYICAAYVRLTRSSLLEVLGGDYVKFARIKGVPEFIVVAKHALRNALIPVISFAGVQLMLMINGGVVVEIVFGWPGTGLLMYNALVLRDYPLVQTVVLITATLMVGANLTVDILYAYIDPRIRLR